VFDASLRVGGRGASHGLIFTFEAAEVGDEPDGGDDGERGQDGA